MLGHRLEVANKVAARAFWHYHVKGGWKLEWPFKNRAATFGSYRKTKVPCSGPCCGYPRRWFG